MEKYQGVAMTDGINRKNHIFPLSAIIKAYHASWHTALPVNLGHDRTKPIGYTMLTGIYGARKGICNKRVGDHGNQRRT